MEGIRHKTKASTDSDPNIGQVKAEKLNEDHEIGLIPIYNLKGSINPEAQIGDASIPLKKVKNDSAGGIVSLAINADLLDGQHAISFEMLGTAKNAVTAHETKNTLVHGFDAKGKASPQSHGNEAHSTDFLSQDEYG